MAGHPYELQVKTTRCHAGGGLKTVKGYLFEILSYYSTAKSTGPYNSERERWPWHLQAKHCSQERKLPSPTVQLYDRQHWQRATYSSDLCTRLLVSALAGTCHSCRTTQLPTSITIYVFPILRPFRFPRLRINQVCGNPSVTTIQLYHTDVNSEVYDNRSRGFPAQRTLMYCLGDKRGEYGRQEVPELPLSELYYDKQRLGEYCKSSTTQFLRNIVQLLPPLYREYLVLNATDYVVYMTSHLPLAGIEGSQEGTTTTTTKKQSILLFTLFPTSWFPA